MRIGLDIDGVLYPWHDSIYRYFQEFKGFTGEQRDFWLYFRQLPERTQDYYVSIPLCYLDTMPSKDVLTTLPLLAELGEIHYITSRKSELVWATLKFFDIYELPFKENLTFSANKAEIIRLHRVDYYLDDIPHYIDQVKLLTKAYLMRVPHNFDQRDGYETVGSLREFYEVIHR